MSQTSPRWALGFWARDARRALELTDRAARRFHEFARLDEDVRSLVDPVIEILRERSRGARSHGTHIMARSDCCDELGAPQPPPTASGRQSYSPPTTCAAGGGCSIPPANIETHPEHIRRTETLHMWLQLVTFRHDDERDHPRRRVILGWILG